ncbi:hypothetical protein HO133_007336 [Letharia lupina]|uniref:Uncharacterized protein n=1 Tax=Letharia lupina TaxID=560253 RepID=A0A8H6FIK1_9LECA|nr:uncharacterized protein HO133_007336 [Letharia lupina]KAF6229220.1 hypothetical protein HO133_007336 [Letharia lupina]
MNSYASRLASFTSWPHVCPSASTVARAGFHREYDPTFPSPDLTQKKKHRNQKTRQQHKRSLQAVKSVTQPATQPEHSVKQEEEQYTAENIAEEPLQQAHTENTAEKPSDNKAIITKNTAQLSKIQRHILSTLPRQIFTQQAENTTATWPVIPATFLWHTITELSIQEKDLLRRSQPNHYDQLGHCRRKIGRFIIGRIETVRCLVSTAISLVERFHYGRRFCEIHTTN